MVVAAALAGAGCGGDSADSGTDGDQTTATTTTAPERPVRIDRNRVGAALNVLVAECIRRRRAGAAARDVTRRFQNAVNTLIVQYRIAPRRSFAPKPGAPRTTMEQVLGRVRNTLGRPIPDGCGARTAARRQKAAIRQLDQALKSGP